MEKARSRLKPTSSPSSDQPTVTSKPILTHVVDQRPHLLNTARIHPPRLTPKRYLHHWPTGILGFAGWVAVYLIFTRVRPSVLSDWPAPESYGVLLAAFFIAVTFSVAFITLNTRRGLLIGLLTTCWLSLRLQHIVSPWWAWLLIALVLGGIELVFARKRPTP